MMIVIWFGYGTKTKKLMKFNLRVVQPLKTSRIVEDIE